MTADTPDSDGASQLGARTIRSFAWAGGQSIAVRLLSLVTFIVLARLLTPRDYGIAAIASVFASLLALVAAGGFSQTLVQKATVDESDKDTVFWISVGTATALSLALAGLAWPVSAYFRLPELQPVLWVLSPMFLAIGLGSVHMGLLQRTFRFSTLARIGVLANVVATAVGIVLAVIGAGYWALVIQSVLPPVLGCAAVWWVSDYRPGLRFSRERFGQLFKVSRQFLGDTLLTFVNEQADKLLIGRILGPTSLGVYSVAYRVVFIMLEVLSRSTQLVALPAFSRLQQDGERMRTNYLAAVRLCATVTIPFFVVVACTAEDLVGVVFGHRWLGTTPMIEVFCIYGAIQTLLTCTNVFLQAVGHAKAVLRLNASGTALQLVAVLLAVQVGVVWVAWAFVLRAGVLLPLAVYMAARLLDRGTGRAVFGSLAGPLAAAVVLVAASLGVQQLGWVTEGLVTLTVVSLVAPVSYVGTLALVGRPHLRQVWALGTALRRSTNPGSTA